MSPRPQPTRKRWPIWLQLALALIVVLFLVNLVTVFLARDVVSKFAFEQAEEHSRSSFALLSATAIDAVITEDIPLLETVATQSFEQSPNMVGLTMENEYGSTLVHRERPLTTTDDKIRNYSYDIKIEGELFGTIRILWDIEPIEQKIYRHVNNVQIFFSAMLILLAVLTVILFHWISVRPIHLITHYLTSLSENRQPPPLKLPLSTSRELELLSASANQLSDMMQQRDKREQELLATREDLQTAHDQALSAIRAKSDFLATMSHEIRTPLNAILGILGLLRDTSLDNNQTQLVLTGRDSSELLLTTINEILEFSKMDAGKLKLEHSGFNLHQLITDSIEILRHQVERKGLTMSLSLDPKLPQYVRGDPDRLRQILINLISNAVKFTSSGGITIRASRSSNDDSIFTFRCSVRDTGIGIPRELQASLFDEFTMADQSHSRLHEGTGLGLAICKRLVSLMQGRIRCGSVPGKGSIFAFSIPFEHAEASECNSRDEFDEPRILPSGDTRILLAEDNPANQMVIKSILEYSNLQVDIVSNGEEAVEAIRELPYDIVLMDISMPDMDGITATREIRRLPGSKGKVPIIALTAHAMSGDRERIIEAGMDDYLSKPIERHAMLGCIVRWTLGSVSQPPKDHTEIIETDAGTGDSGHGYVDQQVLQQLVRDTSPDIVPDLLRLYIEDSEARTNLIQKALEENDLQVLEFETHTLGSSAAAHGNQKLHLLAREIEQLCRESKAEQAIALARTFPDVALESFRRLTQIADQGFEADKQDQRQ